MHTAILLCLGILASDYPTDVRVKVVSGSTEEAQSPAEIERWIHQQVKTTGATTIQPHTKWISLSGELERIYTPKHGGMYVEAKAITEDGHFQVVVEGCAGFAIGGTVTLEPGERHMINVFDDPGPNSLFVAVEAPVSGRVRKRAQQLTEDVKSFRLKLDYHGEEGKPYYRMAIATNAARGEEQRPFSPTLHVTEPQAIAIIQHLARVGYLDEAIDLRSNAKIPPPSMPGYTMKVEAGDIALQSDLGWGLSMIHRLDAFREALPADGQKPMEMFLGRLSGWRKQWEQEDPPFRVNAGREGSQLNLAMADGKMIVDIKSEFGIDQATLRRESRQRPTSIVVRLHLRGLEMFHVRNGEVGVDWSVSNSGDLPTSVYLRRDYEEGAVDDDSPYYSAVRIVGGNEKIPLQGGYFEVPLPPALLKRNPQQIRLEWVDFYRN